MAAETPMPDDLLRRYRSAFLSHEPARYACMLSPAEAEAKGEKYHDVDGALTNQMLVCQLEGRESYAVPWEANGLASVLPLDIDSGGLAAIQALLTECQRRGLWAFGQYTPHPGLPDEEQHGYVFVPFSDLVNVERIQRLGDELLASVEGSGWKIENRAHGADTRLPMTRHQVNGSFGELVLPDETIPIDPDPTIVLNLLFAVYQENPTHLLPPAPEASSSTREQPRGYGIDIARFNQAHELAALLEYYGAKRIGRGLYLCPFHDDRRASLGVYVRNGQTFCHCLSKHSDCPLSQRGRNDAFNVYCIAEGLTTEEALRKINDVAR
jgi:hypothetical protein